jgi:hypothetical protein
MSLTEPMRWRAGGCHCGAVRFEVLAPETIEVEDCNCSICARSGYLHLISPAARFRLLSGRDSLTIYRFGTGAAEHLFCKVCGVKSFYIPRSNPDGVSVNLRCLDQPDDFVSVRVVAFDGRNNWEAQAAALAGKSRD